MKTIRTIIATLSGVLLAFAVVAWFSVRRNAAFLQRTIYQGFDQTFVVALVMGCAFLLISIILTVAIVSTENDDEEDEEEEEEPVHPRRRSQPGEERRSAAPKGEQPYRRVSRTRPVGRPEEDAFARPKAAQEQSKPKKQARAAESPDQIAVRREEVPVKKAGKHVDPEDEAEEVRIAPTPKRRSAETEWEPKPAKTPAEPEPVPAPAADPEPEEADPVPAEEPEAVPEPEAADVPEEAPVIEDTQEAPQIAPETPEEGPEAMEEAPAAEAEGKKEDMVVRCVFCGSGVLRGTKVCPHCGKKM